MVIQLLTPATASVHFTLQVHYLREAYTGRGLLLEDVAPASTPTHHPLQDFADDFVAVAERSKRYFAGLVGVGGRLCSCGVVCRAGPTDVTEAGHDFRRATPRRKRLAGC